MSDNLDSRAIEALRLAGQISTLLELSYGSARTTSAEPEAERYVLDTIIDANRETLRLLRNYVGDHEALDVAYPRV